MSLTNRYKKPGLFLVAVVLLGLMLAVFVASCGSEETTTTTAAPATATTAAAGTSQFVTKEPLKFGYGSMGMEQPYWQLYYKGIQDQAKKYTSEPVPLVDFKNSADIQVSGSMDLINQGISALIISPTEVAATPAIIDAAHAQKIPVIIGDVGAQGPYDAFVLSDNYDGGVLAATFMINQLKDRQGTKEVAMIILPAGAGPVGERRAQGFKDTMAKQSDFKIVGEVVGDYTVQGGFKATQDLMTANPNLAGVYTCNDPMGEGASQALKQAGKDPVSGIVLCGYNGDPPALELIKSGDMAATIAQDPYGQGIKCVELAMQFLKGETVAFSEEATKSIFFPVMTITKDNVDDYQATLNQRLGTTSPSS